jgi:uncharacterized protein with von Willebrand factor type A (vWA) domain
LHPGGSPRLRGPPHRTVSAEAPRRHKMPIHREGIILILDNSGSMFAWAEMLTAIAELAAQRRDVEIYVAPNGRIEEQISPTKKKAGHNSFIDKTTGRVIIYVGDFDGGVRRCNSRGEIQSTG